MTDKNLNEIVDILGKIPIDKELAIIIGYRREETNIREHWLTKYKFKGMYKIYLEHYPKRKNIADKDYCDLVFYYGDLLYVQKLNKVLKGRVSLIISDNSVTSAFDTLYILSLYIGLLKVNGEMFLYCTYLSPSEIGVKSPDSEYKTRMINYIEDIIEEYDKNTTPFMFFSVDDIDELIYGESFSNKDREKIFTEVMELKYWRILDSLKRFFPLSFKTDVITMNTSVDYIREAVFVKVTAT